MAPGWNGPPHNHRTRAVIAAQDGEELNRIYSRVDDGADAERAQLALDREFTVKPGDRVLISKYGGTEIKLDGEDYLILSENDILAIIG